MDDQGDLPPRKEGEFGQIKGFYVHATVYVLVKRLAD